MLELHRTLGIKHFKIDSINAKTACAQSRLLLLLAAIRDGSKGQIVIDLDITASARPGYFGAIAAGPLFLENRYTDNHNYWPHQTLRALWLLSRWVDPLRLRMEFLNCERNQEKYQGDPLAPACYQPDALFAMVMFANPLGWFEISNLPEEYFKKIAPLVSLWKELRADIFRGTIIPIGSAPDGLAWTGFLSMAPEQDHGHAIVFRELNDGSTAHLNIPCLKNRKMKWETLSGNGKLRAHDMGLKVSIPEQLGYVFGKFTIN